ncbi:GMC family oxidoreductase [Fluviispira multicolorata]|uniref:NAD(P)-binding protein n=1 Tax=Fluviispira multicolorata TaxID=2654512 RepID=A0A833JDB2_9BACT|nr:GMC family oxidoreductase [Fluviispira multicolorata]KAB8028477.1 NAD(P)-binding protein [Fluviispira multicolorata]
MENLTSDIVIVGSGIAGSIMAERLSRKGLKVIILEAGSHVDRGKAFNTFINAVDKIPESAYEQQAHARFPLTVNESYFVQKGKELFKSTYLRVAGGTTWHWQGTVLRLLPEDFQMKSKYNVAFDWPITYNDLEFWYEEAEKELGTSGFNGEDLGSPRKNKYPLPEIPFSNLDQFMIASLKKSEYKIVHTPQARNSIPYDMRSACCGSASCIPICPVQAKYDATVHLNKAQKNGAKLVTNAVAYEVVSEKSGKISEIKFKIKDGKIFSVKGNTFILAANAIENAKLLLMSKSEYFKNGIANLSDQVGRNLMDHPVILAYGLAPERIFPYRSPTSTAGIDETRRGAYRKDFASYRLEISNDGWTFPIGGINPFVESLIEKGFKGKKLEDIYRESVYRQVTMAALTEQLPDPYNRVIPSYKNLDAIGIPRPEVYYALDSYTNKSFSDSRKKMIQILNLANCTQIKSPLEFYGAGHVMGTHRMGKDSKTSVVDEYLRSHEHHNLFLLGAGVMPTTGSANPTLTIAALSLKCSHYILNQYHKV